MTDTAETAAGIDGCRGVVTREAGAVLEVLHSDPLVSAPAAEKLDFSGVLPGPDGRFLTIGGPARSLLYIGTSVLPLRGAPRDLRAFGRAVNGLGFGTMSVHGRRDHVAGVWETLGLLWGIPRDYRGEQILMTLDKPINRSSVSADVRPAALEEFEAVLPAAAAMYQEELGSDPFAVGAGVPFRRRVARSLARGRTWIAVDQGRVVFKADITAVAPGVAQIQGVWVHPDRRGTGLGARGTATVCSALQSRDLTPSLVVNESNAAAVAAYRKVGMTPAVPYATVLTY